MDTWTLLNKELDYYGIHLIGSKRCQTYNENEEKKTQGIVRVIKQLDKEIKKQKKTLLLLWKKVVILLQKENLDNNLLDEKMKDLFIFSLKDMSKYLMCFERMEGSVFDRSIESSLSRDIKSFSKDQVYVLPDYKISIDWVTRSIQRLLYVIKLLSHSLLGKEKINKYEIKMVKTASGVAGPWAHLDLPLLERVFSFGTGLYETDRAKQHQRRYRDGFKNYNSEGVGDGYYWRELKNEPFSWYDRGTEDPYPHRDLLNNWG